MRIVPKALYGRPLVALSDNTRVARPVLVERMEYKPRPGEFFITDRRTGKKVLVKRKNETVSTDRRSTYLRLLNLTRAKQIYRLYEEDKKLEEGMKNLLGFLTFISPSTYIGPVFNNNGKSYIDNVMSGEGTGDTAGNVVIDMLTPFAIRGAKSLATNAVKKFPYRPNTSSLLSIPYDILFKSKEGRGIVALGILRGKLPPTSGMRVIPLETVNPEVSRIMNSLVFSRLGEIPPENFYSDIYLGSRSLMQNYNPKVWGVNFPGERIVIKEGIPQVSVLPHELRHRLDDIYPLPDELQLILNKAYSNDFNSDEIKKAAGLDSSYDMSKEAVTTNLDSRIYAANKHDPKYYLSAKYLNELIDDLLDHEIVDAVSNSNGYGLAYINYLKLNNLLTKDKILTFRDAMKYVGGVSIPVTIGTSTLR